MASVSFFEHTKIAVKGCAWDASYGLAAGSIAGYIATSLKAVKAASFINLGLAAASSLAVNSLLVYIVKRSDSIQGSPWARSIINKVAIPTISLLAGIYVLPYANITVYTITSAVALTLVAARWMESVPRHKVPSALAF